MPFFVPYQYADMFPGFEFTVHDTVSPTTILVLENDREQEVEGTGVGSGIGRGTIAGTVLAAGVENL